MYQKGFIKKQMQDRLSEKRYPSVVINILMYTGIILILSSLVYMIRNLERADTIITLWLPFIISGVVLVFMSTVFSWQNSGTKK